MPIHFSQRSAHESLTCEWYYKGEPKHKGEKINGRNKRGKISPEKGGGFTKPIYKTRLPSS